MSIGQIIGLIALFSFSLYIIYIVIHKRRKAVERIKQNLNDEIARVIISREGLPDSLGKLPHERMIVLLFIIIILLIPVVIIIMEKFNSLYVGLIILPPVFYAFYLVHKYTNYTANTQKYLSKYLLQKYVDIQEIPTARKEIVIGSKSEVGNIRENDIYLCNVKPYHCTLRVYYEEEMVEELINNGAHSTYSYHYQKQHKYVSYDYNFSDINTNFIDLKSEIYSDIIKYYSSQKIIKKIDFVDNHLIIIKETILNGYQEQDAERDCNDIELFYKSFIGDRLI
ncbi:MAG: hypothetical protein IKF71_02675 [Bacilli bacterium]|nr:hypothetical protein [Bacilli bacterium]